MSDLQLEVNRLRAQLRQATEARDFHFEVANKYYARCEAAEKECDDLRAQLVERADERETFRKWAMRKIDQLSQRRDFTLTAARHPTIDDLWFLNDATGKTVASYVAEDDAKALERWSREEATVEPHLCSLPHDHDAGTPLTCAGLAKPPDVEPLLLYACPFCGARNGYEGHALNCVQAKPPAPYLAALRERAISQMCGLVGLPLTPVGVAVVADALRALWLADIDAKLKEMK